MTVKAETVTSAEDLATLEDDWERLRLEGGASIFTSPLWTLTWLKHFQDQVSTRALVLREGGEMVGMAPLVTYRSTFAHYPVTYLCLAGNFGETTEFHDLQFLHSDDAKKAANDFIGGMKRIRWNLLQLRDLRWNAISQQLLAQAPVGWRCEDLVSKACPYVPLAPDRPILDGFEAREGRKVMRVLASLEKEGRIELAVIRDGEGVARSIDTYIEQHKERWANKGGSIFHEPRQSGFLKDIGTRAADKGLLVAYEVRIDGEVAAQQLCIRDGSSLRMWKIGMNDKHRTFIPGYLSVYLVMTEAQREGFQVYDLGPGPEEYKHKVGGVDHYTHNIQGRRGSMMLLSKASHVPGMRKLAHRALRSPDAEQRQPKSEH
ncbi:MAG: GNAT family N-acetyltransferase [Methanomassiliicoccales archaeon]|nr:GNAT family N-acetyltransferase [Methanomassiliicoccales archaeon]MDD1755818.1 GNAT family N-acetyltransferase [Methanomassiliicoccales archaeon]